MGEMPLPARRVFRLALTMALALVVAYGLAPPLPFLAPVFALMLAAKPAPPIGVKGLLLVALLLTLTLGTGLLLAPLLQHYAAAGVLIAALGVYLSNYLTLNLAKGMVGMLLIVGITMISAAATLSPQLASAVIQALVIGVFISVFCLWLVYPLFPEDPVTATGKPSATEGGTDANWIALRATLIVLPAWLLALTNPSQFMMIIMKSVALGQQGSLVDARRAGRELLGSTLLAGVLAVLFWFALKLQPGLWMFFLLMLLFGIYLAGKLHGVLISRFTPSFWQNTALTMLILLGPAVEDSANGKDVYQAFAVRMGLFIAVTLYAWLAIRALEWLRGHRRATRPAQQPETA